MKSEAEIRQEIERLDRALAVETNWTTRVCLASTCDALEWMLGEVAHVLPSEFQKNLGPKLEARRANAA